MGFDGRIYFIGAGGGNLPRRGAGLLQGQASYERQRNSGGDRLVKYISLEDALSFEIDIDADPEEIPTIIKGMKAYMNYLKKLPTVEHEKGFWIVREDYDGSIYCECSTCGDCFDLIEGEPEDNDYFFCPNCGAEKRGIKYED